MFLQTAKENCEVLRLQHTEYIHNIKNIGLLSENTNLVLKFRRIPDWSIVFQYIWLLSRIFR